MKKFTSLLIGCSLALSGIALAQQPEPQGSPNKKKGAEKGQATEAHPQQPAAKPQHPSPRPQQAGPKAQPPGQTKLQHEQREPGITPAPAKPNPGKGQKAQSTPKPAAPNANAAKPASQPTTSVPPTGKQAQHGAKGMKAANATPAPSASAPAASATPATAAASASPPPATQASPANATANTAAATQPHPANPAAAAKKPAPQQVQQIKAQHASFHAQPKPEHAPPVTFNQNYRFEQAHQWQGPQYEVFRSYHPEWHDQGWYHSRYHRVELIGGGYYYWNNGYWYPAWGYDQHAAYYPYDGPIYVGHRAEPPDQVIADVQTELQQMGYYKGEVDGLVGPLTREALTAYQADNGLYQTAAIDEPTLDSLGLAS